MSLSFTPKRLIVVSAFILCIVIAAAARFGIVSEANTAESIVDPMGMFFVPNITATKTAALAVGGDVNGNGFINPGDTLAYSVTVNNLGTDATGVNFTDVLDGNLTLVGTVKVSPIAVDDSYTATGNVMISVPAGSGVSANDYIGLNPTATVTAFDATSTGGGSVSVNADGSFTYTNGGSHGIILTGTTGNFTVTGDGTGFANGSGGTIQNIVKSGVLAVLGENPV